MKSQHPAHTMISTMGDERPRTAGETPKETTALATDLIGADRYDRMHHVEKLMSTPGFEPVAEIISSLHRLNHGIIQATRRYDITMPHCPLDSIIPGMGALADDIINVIAYAGEHHRTPDYTLSMIGSAMLNPSLEHESHPNQPHRTAAPFPWTEDDALKTALAIPEAASISLEYLAESIEVARTETLMEFHQSISIGDIPAVFPVAIAKGFNPGWLTAGPEKMNADEESRIIRILLRLRGDWRPGIYGFISEDPAHSSRGKEHLLSYLKTDPATYGADWILAIINHIDDRDLDKAEILHNPGTVNTMVAKHSANRFDHPSRLYGDGLHERFYDIGSICETSPSHGATITGLPVRAEHDTNPAALETVFGILDTMSVGMEQRLVNDMNTVGLYKADTLIVDAVHDMMDGLPLEYAAETLASRAAAAGTR